MFVDESGIPYPCNLFILVALINREEWHGSYFSLGRDVLFMVKRLLRVERSRELKYVSVKKRSSVLKKEAYNLILEKFRVVYLHRHVTSQIRCFRLTMLTELVEEVGMVLENPSKIIFIVDEMPIKLNLVRKMVLEKLKAFKVPVEVKMKSSVKVSGLQLADYIAGYVREKILRLENTLK